jgi:hypothetical protein
MNIFPKHAKFFPVPQHLIDAGIWRELSGPAKDLYMYLLMLAQKHSAVRIQTVGYEIHDWTGVHENSQKKAREELAQFGLIAFKRIRGCVYEYQMLDPATGQALAPPVDPKTGKPRRGIREWKPDPLRSAKTSLQHRRKLIASEQTTSRNVYPMTWDEVGAHADREPGEDEGDSIAL